MTRQKVGKIVLISTKKYLFWLSMAEIEKIT